MVTPSCNATCWEYRSGAVSDAFFCALGESFASFAVKSSNREAREGKRKVR